MRLPTAVVLHSAAEVDHAPPGLYVVRAGSGAYFPAMALLEAGRAKFWGETYQDHNLRIVTLEIGARTGLGEPPRPVRQTSHQITIGPEYFLLAMKDYHNWEEKWWREVIQNAVDAGARHVALGVEKTTNDTYRVWCDDDGVGMDEDTLLDKFLQLGGTTKTAASGMTGGFGKAKELILLPWSSWRVHSRDTLVEGVGGSSTVTRVPMRRGTLLEVIMPADRHTEAYYATGFLQKSFIPQTHFLVDGKPVKAALAPQQLLSSVPGKVDIYYNPLKAGNKQSYLYVRARGIYMFSRYITEVPGYVIAELTAPSVDILLANRDGFRDRQVEREIDLLATTVAKDNMSALRSKQGLIRQRFVGSGRFRAQRLGAELLNQIGPTVSGRLSDADNAQLFALMVDYTQDREATHQASQLPPPPVAQLMLDQRFRGPSHIEAALKQLVWEPDFYLMNDIEGWKVPKKFFPATMTPFVLKLAKSWVELCRFVLMQLGSSTKFGVGFIFSRHMAAAAETSEDDEGIHHWLLLNPFKAMSGGDIWHPSQHADLQWLYAAAIHEATHIADGLAHHDEAFASALTLNMAKTADGYRKIRAIIGGIRMHGGMQADVDD
jgi:hypothetical protein